MLHGGDLAQAHAHVGTAGGRGGAIGSTDPSPRVQRPPASIPNLLALSAETQKIAADRNHSLEALSGRALDIATRLAGSFPAPGSKSEEPRVGGASFEDPESALDAVQQQVGAIRTPLFAMDPSFARLAAALDAIERTLG